MILPLPESHRMHTLPIVLSLPPLAPAPLSRRDRGSCLCSMVWVESTSRCTNTRYASGICRRRRGAGSGSCYSKTEIVICGEASKGRQSQIEAIRLGDDKLGSKGISQTEAE